MARTKRRHTEVLVREAALARAFADEELDESSQKAEFTIVGPGDPMPAAKHRYTPRIDDLAEDERPRERLLKRGPGACSAGELLAILLRTGDHKNSAIGVADNLLKRFGGLRGLVQASVEEFQQIDGVGPVKAIEIAAAIELSKRLQVVSDEDKPTIRNPQDVANLVMPELRDERVEHLRALLLDTKNRVMRIANISTGTLDSSLVHPREVFRQAIAASAAAIIVVHNHPSGDPTPSEEDRRVTTRLVSAGSTIGIDVLDHIIIGLNRWVSMKEKGLM